MKARYLGGSIGLASVVLLIALVGSASAKDQWFVLGEKVDQVHGSKHGDQGRRGEDVEGGHQEDQDHGRGR